MIRRLPLAAVLAVVVMAALGLPGDPAASDVGFVCKGTRPNHVVPPDASFTRSGFNYGGARLRAHLNWSNGTMRAGELPGGGSVATVNADGSIWTKQGWWRGTTGKLVIIGRRLDAPGRLRGHVPDGYGPRGFVPVGLTFPSVGCWRITGRVGSVTLSYAVRVVALELR